MERTGELGFRARLTSVSTLSYYLAEGKGLLQKSNTVNSSKTLDPTIVFRLFQVMFPASFHLRFQVRAATNLQRIRLPETKTFRPFFLHLQPLPGTSSSNSLADGKTKTSYRFEQILFYPDNFALHTRQFYIEVL